MLRNNKSMDKKNTQFFLKEKFSLAKKLHPKIWLSILAVFFASLFLLLSIGYIHAQESISNRLKGRILLQVKQKGEAWYVNPVDKKRYFMGRPNDAFNLMRNTGIGVTNKDLKKISIAEANTEGEDADGDGLSDAFEDAVGTDKNNVDTDRDGYNDKAEIINGHNPNGQGKINTDNSFANEHKGKIFIQVEAHGEAWYVNPVNKKRYFLFRPSDAFNIMRSLGLGITDNDLNKIEKGEHKSDGANPPLNITRTSGTYMKHNWYIDENHVMYWDGKPYIHYGLSGPRDYKDITKTYEFIDNLASKGIKDYMLWYEGDQESGQWTKEEYNNWIDKTTDYITKKGGTYIFILQPFYAVKADGVWDTAFMNRDDVKQDILNEFNRFKPLVTKEGLRGLGFSSEINTVVGVSAIKAPNQENDFDNFKEMLNFYAKSMKDTFGDLPVLFRMGEHQNYIPFLYAMTGDYIDGIIAEYNQFSPNDVKDQMTKSPYIEYFNSFDKTKFYWVNLQVNFETTLTWVPYVSYDVMWRHHKIAVDNGATGSSLDMSNYDWVLNNCQCGTLNDTWTWYGQFKNSFTNLILDKAKNNEFVTGNYSPKKVSYTYKTPKMNSNQIISAIKSTDSFNKITNSYSCLQLLASEPPIFEKSKGTWSTSLVHKGSGKEFYCFEVDDAGNIVRDCTKLEKEAISLGYTYTIKDELNKHIQDSGCN